MSFDWFLDHQAILGNTYAEITAEKAGVLKNGKPFIYAADRTDVRDVFREGRRVKKGPKTYMSWGDFTAEGVQAIPLIFTYEQRLR